MPPTLVTRSHKVDPSIPAKILAPTKPMSNAFHQMLYTPSPNPLVPKPPKEKSTTVHTGVKKHTLPTPALCVRHARKLCTLEDLSQVLSQVTIIGSSTRQTLGVPDSDIVGLSEDLSKMKVDNQSQNNVGATTSEIETTKQKLEAVQIVANGSDVQKKSFFDPSMAIGLSAEGQLTVRYSMKNQERTPQTRQDPLTNTEKSSNRIKCTKAPTAVRPNEGKKLRAFIHFFVVPPKTSKKIDQIIQNAIAKANVAKAATVT